MNPRSGPATAIRPRGGPLVMLALLLAGWGGARALLWENPFAPLNAVRDLQLASLTPSASDQAALPGLLPPLPALSPPSPAPFPKPGLARLALPSFSALGWRSGRRPPALLDPRFAAAHRLAWYAAQRDPLGRPPTVGAIGPAMFGGQDGWTAGTPFRPAPAAQSAAAAGGRWSLDAWAFWRQGSDAAPVSQGRVPVYGASQAGAVLQYRLAPASARDPRLYARAYRALVQRGESEAALGVSARPFGRVPVRLAGEVRYTDGAFTDALRPAAYAVTELAPIALPFDTQLEAYGQAGYVGGPGATAFADGQASVTRELRQLAGLTDNAARLSLGAAAWGGAQEDAQRIDIGPTMRLDLTLGDVPARLSVDWRERVGGDAGPESGLAATLSTRF